MKYKPNKLKLLSEEITKARFELAETLATWNCDLCTDSSFDSLTRQIDDLISLECEHAQLEVIDDPDAFGIEIPNCDDCERPNEDSPRYNEGME
jgi:hypothetical protein